MLQENIILQLCNARKKICVLKLTQLAILAYGVSEYLPRKVIDIELLALL